MTVPSDWAYLSEGAAVKFQSLRLSTADALSLAGGANIVFRYVGPPHATLSSHVLRLRKAASLGSSGWSSSDVEAELCFRERVIRPLLGEALLPDCRLLALDEGLLKGLAELAEPHRPAARRAKGGLAVDATEGMLVADLIGRDHTTLSDVLAVEIKVGTEQLERPPGAFLMSPFPSFGRSQNGASCPPRRTSRPRHEFSKQRTAERACIGSSSLTPRMRPVRLALRRARAPIARSTFTLATSRGCGVPSLNSGTGGVRTRKAKEIACAFSSTDRSFGQQTQVLVPSLPYAPIRH